MKITVEFLIAITEVEIFGKRSHTCTVEKGHIKNPPRDFDNLRGYKCEEGYADLWKSLGLHGRTNRPRPDPSNKVSVSIKRAAASSIVFLRRW
tara:strand:- start:244 stop:522 length:279 start_codon:yes stop_codon:yes gene_type:complete